MKNFSGGNCSKPNKKNTNTNINTNTNTNTNMNEHLLQSILGNLNTSNSSKNHL